MLAEAYHLQSRWAEADAILQPYEALDVRAALPTPIQQRLCLRLAALRTEQGIFTAAKQFAHTACVLAEMQGDVRGQGAAQQALGKVYRLLGETAFAAEHYEAALQLHRQVGDRVLMARSYFDLSVISGSRSDYPTAQHYLKQALELLCETDDPLLYGYLCGGLGATISLEEAGGIAERVQWFQQAQTTFTSLGQKKYLARTLNNWGFELLKVGQWQEAQQLFEQAITLGKETNDRQTIASVLESLGEIHALQGNYERGQAYLAEALTYVAGYDQFVETQVHLALARLLQWQGEWEQAQAHLAQVQKLAAQTGTHLHLTAAQLQLADIACEQNEWDTVEQLLTTLPSEVGKFQNLWLTGCLRFVQGRFALHQTQYPEAQAQWQQACTIFDLSGRRFWLGRTHWMLAQMHDQLGNASAARAAARQARAQFQALSATPWLAAIERWSQREARPASTVAPQVAATIPKFITPETHLTRLLDAMISREVFVQELLQVLHDQLPATTIVLYERTNSGAARVLGSHPPPQTVGKLCVDASAVRLATFQDTSLFLSLHPVPRSWQPIAGLLKAAGVGLKMCYWQQQEPLLAEYAQSNERVAKPLPGLLYRSRAMYELASKIHKLQGDHLPVLITGESGTGKELVARAIHTLSACRQHPFLPLNCSSTSKDRLDDQLFGHKRGAFTGATEDAPGAIRAAAGGTLFLDEIGELPRESQPKLLRFLEAGEIQPLGVPTPQQVKVRVIAATNADVEVLMEQGKFRADLYYRLNIIRLHLPPLRERREEIAMMARHFLKELGQMMSKERLRFAPETLAVLTAAD